MTDEIKVPGAMAVSGLAAAESAHRGACANCGAALSGPFCAQCGQRAHLHRSIGDVFHEFLHGITHFDGKAWTTLPMLLFRPGHLTRSYIDGHRARYIAPVPLFLLVIFLMFFVLSFAHLSDAPIDVGGSATPTQREVEIRNSLADLDKQIAVAQAAGKADEAARLKLVRDGMNTLGNKVRRKETNAGDVLNVIGHQLAEASARNAININSGLPWLDAKARDAMKNPALVLYKLQAKAYKLSFLLVPLSLPWLWLAFCWRRDTGMYDHAIFALYSISFMSLLFIAGSIALTAGVTTSWFWQVLLLLPAIHMFAQLRGTYALSWWGAGWRTFYLSITSVFTFSVYLMILIILGVVD